MCEEPAIFKWPDLNKEEFILFYNEIKLNKVRVNWLEYEVAV